MEFVTNFLSRSFRDKAAHFFGAKALLMIGVLFFFTAQSLIAAGTIKGNVYDQQTHEVLLGASVLVKGTSIGASTDLNGAYTIHNAPSGTQTLVVTYVGYESTSETVEVPEKGTLQKDFYLTARGIRGREIVVTAQARGQMEAINQQLTSNSIVNIVSADKIRQLPDASASAALSRLPGVSIMNGDQVVIRGLQAKDNVILVNGVQLPSTDQDTRSVGLGFFSSNMLSSIEVIKTVTPDMDANAIGGVVNLRLMEAPKNFHMDFLTQGNYNSQARTTDNYRVWGSVSNRFLDDKLGVFIQGSADRNNAGNDQATAGYAFDTNNPNDPLGSSTYLMSSYTWAQQAFITTNYGGSLILDYALPHGKILLQNTLTRNLNNNAEYQYLAGLQGQQTGYLSFTAIRNNYDRDLDVNALQIENDFGPIKADLTLSHSYSNQHTNIRYGDGGDFFGFTNSHSNLPFLDANGNPIDVTSLISRRATLTSNDMTNLLINPDFANGADLENWLTSRKNDFTQHFYTSALNFSIPVSFSSDFSAVFKFGGKYSRTTRVNNLEEYYQRVGPTVYDSVQNFVPGTTLSTSNPLMLSMIRNNDYTRGKYFLNGTYDMKYVIDIAQMDRFIPLSLQGWQTARHKENSLRYDFNGAEIFSAGYVMGTFNIGPRLTILGGVRFEHYNMNYRTPAVLYVTHPVDGITQTYDTLNTANRNDDNLLPNVQLRYRVTEWMDIRLAYTNTLVRPDYNAIMPSVVFEPGNYGQAGNPKLKPTVSKNYDASVSFFNNEIGLFTVGGYYKHMDNVFYYANNGIYYQNLSYFNVWFPDSTFWASKGITGAAAPTASTPIRTYLNNPNPAHVYGLEFDWQTRFWYLPGPLSYLVFDVNYTHVWSNMDYQQVVNKDSTYTYTDPVTGRQKIGDIFLTYTSVRNARLLDQSNDVLNFSIGADYKGFSGRVSFNLQSNVITTVSPTKPEEDQFTGNIYRWDIALQQKLPVPGLSVGFNVVNLTHQPITTYQRIARGVVGSPAFNNVEQVRYEPRYFELNLRYSL